MYKAAEIYVEDCENMIKLASFDKDHVLIHYEEYHKDMPFLGTVLEAKITSIDSMTNIAFVDIAHEKITKAVMKAGNLYEGQSLPVQLIKYQRRDKLPECSQHITFEGRYWAVKKGRPHVNAFHPKEETLLEDIVKHINVQENIHTKKHMMHAENALVVRECEALQNKLHQGKMSDADFCESILHHMPYHARLIAHPLSFYADMMSRAKKYPELLSRIEKSKSLISLMENLHIPTIIKEAVEERHFLDNGSAVSFYETPALCVIDIDQASYKQSGKDRAILQLNAEAIRYICRLILLRKIGGMIVIDPIRTKNKTLLKDLVIQCKKLLPPSYVHVHGITKMGLLELHCVKTQPSLYESYNG